MQVWVNWVIWVKNYDLENLGKLLQEEKKEKTQ